MDIKAYKKRIEEEIVTPLVNIRNYEDDCGFCTRQVMMLKKLVIKYMKKLNKKKSPPNEKILKQMKKLIFAINKLNRNTDYCMLESDIGDDLCYLIEDIAIDCGYPEIKEDITKPWREEW